MGDNKIRITLLKQAIEEGVKSGRIEDFDPEKHLTLLKSKAKKSQE